MGAGRTIGVIGLLAIAACSSASGDDHQHPQLGTGRSPIINGIADTDAHDSVILLAITHEGQAAGSCTGTMVAPNLVLTARHCVSDTDQGALCKVDGTSYAGGQITSDFRAQDLLVYTGKLAIQGIDQPDRAAARGKQVIAEETSTLCDRDVAFVVLDKDVDIAVAPIRTKEGARNGELLTAVGWGLTEQGAQPNKRLQRTGVKVAGIGPLVMDQETNIGMGRSEFAVREAFCSGDSGGPSFASTGAVVGVVSRGGNGEQGSESNEAASCIGANVIGYYTHLANKAALIKKAFTAAGYELRDEGEAPGKAKGGSCTKNVECSSNACIESLCVTRCDSEDKCPDGEVCKTKNDIKICMEATAEKPPPTTGDDAANGAAPTLTKVTTTTTKEGCSVVGAAGSSSTTSFSALLLGLSLVALKRRRRN
jgi:MYXO-CTERM domain-containing protein